MPQPYRGKKKLHFAALDMLERPELSAYIATISAIWTLVEDMWGAILGMMVGIHQAGVGVAIYHSLTGTGAQRAILNEMADLYLPSELKADFEAIMKSSRQRATERNEIVHGLWFVDPADPNALVLAPRHSISLMFADAYERTNRGLIGKPKQIDISGAVDKRWLVYRKKDFVDSILRINGFALELDQFFDRLTVAKGHPILGPPAPTPPNGQRGGRRPQTT